jgi:hypothetical protein
LDSIIFTNSFKITLSNNGVALFIISSLFNHSCTPNCRYFVTPQQIIFYAIKSIKVGEEITVSYGPKKPTNCLCNCCSSLKIKSNSTLTDSSIIDRLLKKILKNKIHSTDYIDNIVYEVINKCYKYKLDTNYKITILSPYKHLFTTSIKNHLIMTLCLEDPSFLDVNLHSALNDLST